MNQYMKAALIEAEKAYKTNNCPVGAVVVKDNKIISRAYNKKNSSNISVYHAEIMAIIKACKKLKRWILDDCELYVTLEPCDMCLNAIAESRIRKVYYLVDSDYKKNLCSNVNKVSLKKLEENGYYVNILSNFFEKLR